MPTRTLPVLDGVAAERHDLEGAADADGALSTSGWSTQLDLLRL